MASLHGAELRVFPQPSSVKTISRRSFPPSATSRTAHSRPCGGPTSSSGHYCVGDSCLARGRSAAHAFRSTVGGGSEAGVQVRRPGVGHVPRECGHAASSCGVAAWAVGHRLMLLVREPARDHRRDDCYSLRGSGLPIAVAGLIGGHEPFATRRTRSTCTALTKSSLRRLPVASFRLLHLDQACKITALGTPVTSVTGATPNSAPSHRSQPSSQRCCYRHS